MKPGQIIISFFIAVILTLIFALFFRATGPWKGFWIFFLIIFFVALAASEWITPIGTSVWGYYWVPGLFVAVMFALLIAAVTPKGRKDKLRKSTNMSKGSGFSAVHKSDIGEIEEKIYEGDEPINRVAIGGFFWVFIILLVFVVVLGAIIDQTSREVLFIK